MKFVLFNGHHSHPETDNLPAIFADNIDVTNFEQLFDIADVAVSYIAENPEWKLDLYCTGFTPAVCAIINACIWHGVSLTCWHYDNSTNSYKPQDIWTAEAAH